MQTAIRFFDHLQEKFRQVMERELPNIDAAARMVADSCIRGGKFYVFGTGHSHMIAEELYLRAGGLALVHAILPPEMMLHEMPNKSTYLERWRDMPGLWQNCITSVRKIRLWSFPIPAATRCLLRCVWRRKNGVPESLP